MEQPLESATQLRMRLVGLETAVAVPTAAAMMFYIHILLALSSSEWPTFLGLLAAYGICASVFMELQRRRMLTPISDYLVAQQAGNATHAQLREAFRSVLRMPAYMQIAQFVMWAVPSLLLPVGMFVFGYSEWYSGFRLVSMLAVGTTGGLVSSTILYFLVKERFSDLRGALAREFDDPDERKTLIVPVSITRKVLVVVAGSGLALVVFVVAFSYARARESIDQLAANWEASALEYLVPQLELEPEGVSIEDLLPPIPLPFEVEFSIVEKSDEALSASETEVMHRVSKGESVGALPPGGSAGVMAWQSLADGRVVVARTPRETIDVGLGGFRAVLIGAFLLASCVLAGLSHLLSRDVSRGTQLLSLEAGRMAQGDLRKGAVLESEDELGDLGRAFEKMGTALRGTVSRVVEAADRVDAAASDMTTVSDSVSSATADQVRRIQQAGEIMGQINRQVTSISQSAQALNASVEESSSSILELGAAGDELNDTASVLSNKVEETTTSIEQMVASVKQVRSTSESLSDVAAETSSSMEEMASAMRAVDTTAELTAKLSTDVVGSAESGQTKVSQTIEGMQAISDATVTAERVIRGLGDRTKEIGAILDVIDDVADETNLLALNAAIIAAQAGEHGRAFSVVADEIKELADRVLASTKEIGGLIGSVQNESTNAIGAIEDGSRSVASGVELSAEAGTSLEEITRASRESGERIGQIVSAVREQTKAATFVVSLMDRVKNGVEQINQAGMEQDRGNEVVYRSSVTMREVAQQVRRTTEEQSRGFGRIRESVEGVREAVEQINGSLQEQSASCHQVADFLEQVSDGTRSNEEATQHLGESIRDLGHQAEALRDDVAKFQF